MYIPGTTSDEIIDDICDDIACANLSKDSARIALRALRDRVRKETEEILRTVDKLVE